MRRVLMVQLLAVSMFGMVLFPLCPPHGDAFAATVEIATGPDGLLQMEQQGKVTVRALRGWGRLPDTYMKLAQQLRQQGGLDLLGADLAQIRAWIAQAQGGDAVLAGHLVELESLATFMDGGEHLDWTPVQDQSSLPEGALVRQEGKRWTHIPGASMTMATAPAAPESLPAESAPVPAPEPAPAAEPPAPLPEPVSTAPVVSSETQGEGLEFPIYGGKSGTYRARLVVEGLQAAGGREELYFQQQDPSRWLETERVKGMEAEELSSSNGAWSSDAPYETRFGYAQLGTPVSIRVEAPQSPVIELTEQEAKDNVRYEITGREYRFILADSASGEAEIGFEEDKWGKNDGSVSWTPQLDSESGQPVGPRVIGIYMAYKIKKFIGKHEFGRLRADFRRIGWVVVAMPGDIYSDGASMFAVGQEKPLAGAGAEPNWTWPVAAPEKFDFELPEETLKKMEVKLSEDLRKVAWVEGTEGRQRVVLNGVPGKWYNEVPSYMMQFSRNGESFCFVAELGDRKIPVFNGVEGAIFEDLEMLRLSEDGAHTLAAGHVGEGVYRVYLDGVMIRETSARVRKPVLAVDGTAAWVESDKAGGERVFTSAGYEGPAYKSIIETPEFTTRRVELYYIADKDGDQRYLVRNGEELKPGMGVGYEFAVTPDSTFYAYAAPNGNDGETMVVNGKIGPDFSSIWGAGEFNADGTRHAYDAKRGNESVLVIDDAEFSSGVKALKGIWGFTFSPDGTRWAAGFRPNDDEYVMMVDGKEFARRKGKPRKIVFSPDGERVAWLEDAGSTWRAILDGEEGPEVRAIYDEEPPQFSPDGSTLVYFYRDKDKKMHVTEFGGEDRMHDLIPPRAVFTKGGIEYLAIDANRFRRESMPLK
ncbi:hypothetical protein SAMN05421830_104151 [Desulfomicrobium norvegicum]|uniref:WD40-like Beta Propeller Repeat n=1 Tax=Desulfomicrobium norvegicum (strain DSM 1741 / NCIMB 8310) TaxID=52561 RepID=A0A8G2C2C1_DESNO|nr:hypothetical protein [Desulfomicrobium norvegicum]SFL64031.1 hypothetical protein SAMN05421830_104151 [Desulfomicrobium norvegicum]